MCVCAGGGSRARAVRRVSRPQPRYASVRFLRLGRQQQPGRCPLCTASPKAPARPGCADTRSPPCPLAAGASSGCMALAYCCGAMQLQAVQVPTCAQIEFKGLIAVAGRVKLGPILQGAHVVHCTHTPTRAQEALKLNTMTAREPIDVSRRGCSTRTRESWAGTWQAGTPRHEPLRAEARGGD